MIYLRWADVDPYARPNFDPGQATRIVRPLVAAAARARGPQFREALLETLHRELAIAFGPWVSGWSWSASEPGGGGPVRAWCCTVHSVLPEDAEDDPVTATTARVVAAIEDWQGVLGELAALFAELAAEQPLPGSDGPAAAIERAVEIAASRVLAFVIDRTGAEDAWYGTFSQLLAWYVESAGHDLVLARLAIDRAIAGRFESWVEPTAAVATATHRDVGRAIAALATSTDARDATSAWRATRPRASAGLGETVRALERAPVRSDGHRQYIDDIDRARDPDRADRMLAALELCRDSAGRAMALTFDQMCEWQAAVLGEPAAGFRTGTAYAKCGREVYPFTPKTQRQFEEALLDAGTRGAVAIRAARVYLDVCFYHPFSDGNARAARLALDHVLTRNGYALHVAAPVFIVSRTVEDPQLGASLARVLDRLIGPIA